jgi:membrane-associated phospholipid phosphatase
MAHLSAARSTELVCSGVDDLNDSTGVGTVSALAVLLVACLSLIVADDFRISLGDVFGRYWPETWTHDNPSLIGTGAYGFHPFQRGDDIGSFPSGHACRILGFAAVWMIAMPSSRVVATVVCAPMLVSLVAMNYHFVSDVITGSVLGGIVATYAAHLARLRLG